MPDSKSSASLTLDQRIARTEDRIALRRDRLEGSLHAIGERSRDTAASPKMLLAAVAAGFVIDRLGRGTGNSAGRGERPRKAGLAGLFGALGVAVLRQVVGSPGSWAGQAFRYAWQHRRSARAGGSPREAARGANRGPRDRSRAFPIARQPGIGRGSEDTTVPGSTVLG